MYLYINSSYKLSKEHFGGPRFSIIPTGRRATPFYHPGYRPMVKIKKKIKKSIKTYKQGPGVIYTNIIYKFTIK